MISADRKTVAVGIAVGITLILCGVVAWRIDLHELRPEDVQSWGVSAVIGYAVLIMVLGGLGVPPVVFMVPAGTFWSLPVAFGIGICGGLGASAIGFLLSRFCIRETLAPNIPEKIAVYEHRLERHGFSTVLILRLLFYLFPPISWMLGISAIPFSTFLAATLLGILPWTAVYVWTGRGILGFLATLAFWQAGVVIAGVALGLLVWWRWAVK